MKAKGNPTKLVGGAKERVPACMGVSAHENLFRYLDVKLRWNL